MRMEPSFRSYGTLCWLLEHARSKFDDAPRRAHEITSVVRSFADDVPDAPTHVHAVALRGLSRKEHANTLYLVGDLLSALKEAKAAVSLFEEVPGLLFDRARADLVVSKIVRDLGEYQEAMSIAARAADTFRDCGSAMWTNIARLFIGTVLFSTKRFTEGFSLFTEVAEEAEREGDRQTVARCLANAAECARELGRLDAARDLYPRALRLFEELHIQDDANTVRWGYALSLAAEGRTASAASELYKVRAVFLAAGMNLHAASAALDIVRLKFETGQNVQHECTELVPVFVKAGMMQHAIEALAYLREQANADRLTLETISRVRTYFDELRTRPSLVFARAIRDGGEEG
jgi:tetratricopeptide (TPR) repeat protein